MKRLQLVYIFLFFVSLAVIGQVNQVWWSKGRVLHVNPVAGIDSVTFGQFVNADTFLIVIDRASRRIVYDTIDEHVPGMVFHDTIHTTHTVYLKPGRRIGVFSVAKDRQVSFSQGNLQYVRNQDVWKFADQQYEYIGAGNVKDGHLANKIDLFGWSGDNTTAPFGVSTSANNADYAGEFVDWGVNEINIDAPNMWRTLSKDEWRYLINKRDNAAQLYGAACVNGINGVMFMPDDWVCPDGVIFVSGMATKKGSEYYKTQNNYSLDQWAVLENSGAVFLPAAGRRVKDPVNINEYGNYWSSSIKDNQHSHYLAYPSDQIYVNAFEELYKGRSVRLVHDTVVPPPAPCETFEVNGVKFNMMCVEGGMFTMGAGSDAHQVTLSGYYIGETEVTYALWNVVMGTVLGVEETDNKPVSRVSWDDCQKFIAKLNELTGLHFRLPTEAEWEYAARGGSRSNGYMFAGSNDIDSVGWYMINSDSTDHCVAQLMSNELGIYDMTGNVWEWCQDYYDVNQTMHVVKSGSWFDAATACRIDARTGRAANYKSFIGLRLVLDIHQYVDLGLSVKWATFNVGATAPEESGDYFAWGEVEPKVEYSWENYKWCDGTESVMTKYNSIDGLTILQLEDDAAHVNWGGEWRMPTDEELTELREKCTWEWTTQNGVNGYRVIGVNGNSIFLPAGGYVDGLSIYNEVSSGYYWSSSLLNSTPNYACYVYFDLNGIDRNYGSRYFRCRGRSIRPVLPN